MSKPQSKSQLPSEYADYKSSDQEKHLVHALIEVETWQQGKKQSTPHVQKFTPQAWSIFEKNAPALGYTVIILHEPETKEEKAAREEKEAKEAKAEADRLEKIETDRLAKEARDAKEKEEKGEKKDSESKGGEVKK